MKDDVPEGVKKRRLQEVMQAYRSHLPENNKRAVGETHLILVENVSTGAAFSVVYNKLEGIFILIYDYPFGSNRTWFWFQLCK